MRTRARLTSHATGRTGAAAAPTWALPPYWFFLNDEGRRVLNTRPNAARSIGVHVTADVPSRSEDREPALRGHELLTTPGVARDIR